MTHSIYVPDFSFRVTSTFSRQQESEQFPKRMQKRITKKVVHIRDYRVRSVLGTYRGLGNLWEVSTLRPINALERFKNLGNLLEVQGFTKPVIDGQKNSSLQSDQQLGRKVGSVLT
eukprot:jgi/Botrbrau1/10213/Bobra.0362s0003.1